MQNQNPHSLFLSEHDYSLFKEMNDSSELPQIVDSNSQKHLLADRSIFRSFLLTSSFEQPQHFSSEKFDKISAWAVKRNLFPMVIKSASNQTDGQNIFTLKAFRELPLFFEKITSLVKAPVVIEEFVQAKARIEATFFNNKLVLLSQIGLEKSIKLQHNWRFFPIFLPSEGMRQLKAVADLFKELFLIKDTPFRITFALSSSSMIPLSLNFGFNRLEYFAPWGNMLSRKDQNRKNDENAKRLFSKLLLYRLSDAQIKNLNLAELNKLLENSVKKIAVAGTTAILLTSTISGNLLEDSKRADAYMRHLPGDSDPLCQD